MTGIILIKGHGVFTTDAVHDLYGEGMKRALSPHEADEKFGRDADGNHVNPIHVNPHTGEIWDPEHFLIKDRFTAMVDEWARTIRKAKQSKGQPVNEEEIKKYIRIKLNNSAQAFNSFKEEGDIHQYPVIFTDVENGTVNPALITGARSPRYQKHARTRVGNDWRTSGQEVHPRDMKIMNNAGQIVHVTSSNVLHNNHGHMTEAETYGGMNIFDVMMRDAIADPNQPALYIDGIDHSRVRPGKLSAGVIEPSAMVYRKMPDGSFVPALKRSKSNAPHNDGRQPKTQFAHGSHEYLNVLLSLHPAFFEPIAGAQDREQQRLIIAQDIMGPDADPDFVQSLSKTPALALLARHFPWTDSEGKRRATGKAVTGSGDKATGALRVLRQIKQALAVPATDGPMSPQDNERFTHFNHNAGNFGVSRRLNEQIKMSSHAPSDMKELLAASIMLMQNTPESRAASTNFRDIRGVANFDTGQFYKDRLLRRFGGNVQPLDPNSIRFIPPQDIRRMQATPPSPRSNDIPFAGEAGGGRGQAGYAGIGLHNPPRDDDDVQTSVDTLFDVMENLQSADARMNNLILKSLPARRRFNLSDSYDVLSLCETFSLEKRDLHYIDQTMGDWGKIAQNLKVEPDVVKAVKVALRW